MIEIKLIPDGRSELPAEGRDHGILGEKLKGQDPPDHSPAPGWREIEHEVTRTHLYLRIPDDTLDDYADGALDGFSEAVASINGLKRHPDGWVEVEERDEEE